VAPKPKKAKSSLEQLISSHTTLGLLCGELARDSRLPWKARKVFESFAWAIFEQVKALRSQDLSNVPDAFIDIARREVEEAIEAGGTAKDSGTEPDAAIAAVETHQAIDSVDGILGNKAGDIVS
jgi:hypothetical protein